MPEYKDAYDSLLANGPKCMTGEHYFRNFLSAEDAKRDLELAPLSAEEREEALRELFSTKFYLCGYDLCNGANSVDYVCTAIELIEYDPS